jgi:hypothetical protein
MASTSTICATAFVASMVLLCAAYAGPAPRIPSNEFPGRERERFLDQPFPPVPRIELQDRRPKPVIEDRRKAKPKHRRHRSR